MRVAVSVLRVEDKPGVGRAIVDVGARRFASEPSLAEHFAEVGRCSETLATALAAVHTATTVAGLAALDARRDRLLRSLFYLLSSLALLTEEEPELAAAASALLARWFATGLNAVTGLRYPLESDYIRGMGQAAATPELSPLVERTGAARMLVPLAAAQADFDGQSATRAAAAQQVADLRAAVNDAEDHWDASIDTLVSAMKVRWPRTSPDREKVLADVLDPVKTSVMSLRSTASRRRNAAAATAATPTDPTKTS